MRHAKRTLIFPVMKIEDVLESPNSREALEWLQTGRLDTRTLGELPTSSASVKLVRELYSFGAIRVTAVDIETYENGEENTGKIVVSLPVAVEARARKRLFAWCARCAKRLGFEPERDSGQDHIFVMLD